MRRRWRKARRRRCGFSSRHSSGPASCRVEPDGEPFDPTLHEAMAMQPAPDRPPHTVLQVVQKGWLLNGRLLRPARVIVSTTPAGPDAPALRSPHRVVETAAWRPQNRDQSH